MVSTDGDDASWRARTAVRILMVCNEYPIRPHAGIGTVVQIIARGLAAKDHEVTVVGLGNADEETWDGRVKVLTLRRNNTRYIGNIMSRLRLRHWLKVNVKERMIDIVEVPDSQGWLPFTLPDCTTVVRLHLSYSAVGHVTGEPVGRGISLYERRTLLANRNWIAVSQYVLDLTKAAFGVDPKSYTVIRNPAVPMPSVLPEAPDLPKKFILYAGHVCYRKGADILADAAKIVMMTHPDLHLVYVGGVFYENGQQMSDHIKGILSPEFDERVHFLGRLSREMVLACMRQAQVFAFPSKVEGLPMVVLEAMSCGIPVVYTINPPGPELIRDQVDGLLADPLSPSDIAEKIGRLIDDKAFAGLLAKNAKARVAENFSPDKCVEATEAFYHRCVGQRLGSLI
jgi:glycosyltransferase involved in cell wall biosynthesis